MTTNKTLYNQPSAAPVEKMKYVGYGAMAATFLMTFLALKYPDSYKMIPPGFEAAAGGLFAGVIAFVAGYFKRERA